MNYSEAQSGSSDEVSIAGLVTILVRDVGTIVRWGLAVGFVAVLVGLLAPRTYTARATFVPNGASSTSALGSLASQFGIQVNSGDLTSGPDFYSALVTSRAILSKIVVDSFPDPAANDARRPLLDVLQVPADAAPDKRVELGIRALTKAIKTSVAVKTGVVSIWIESTSSALAGALASRMIDEINSFNLQTRRTQASEERRFTVARLAEERDTLRVAERALERFLEVNRQYQNSPQLTFEQDRLRRRVALHQQIVSSLAASAEEVRLRAVRDAPVITVIDQPTAPALPDGRGTVLRLVLGGILGLMFGGVFVAVRALYRRRLADGHPDTMELDRAVRDTFAWIMSKFGSQRVRGGAPSSGP